MAETVASLTKRVEELSDQLERVQGTFNSQLVYLPCPRSGRLAQLARALPLQGRGGGFESLNAHQSRTPIGLTSAQQRCMPGFDSFVEVLLSPRVGDPSRRP